MNPLKPTSISPLCLVGFKRKRRAQKRKRRARKNGYKKMRRGAPAEQQQCQSSSSEIPFLSQDIIMDILSRLPIHSLFQCTLVSKAWRDIIIHNLIFSSMQHNRALENQNDTLSLMLCLNNRQGTHLYLVERGGVGHCKFTMIDAQLTSIESRFTLNGRFEVLGSCNGLLCVSFPGVYGEKFGNGPTFVSNPVTAECMMLPSTDFINAHISGFGFHSARNEYKVLRVVRNNPLSGIIDNASCKVEIHTIGTNAWRQIKDVRLLYMKCLCHQFSNIFVNGSLHWYRQFSLEMGDEPPSHIFSLDMGDEQFRVVTTPDSFNDNSLNDIYTKNLIVWKGYLAVVRRTFWGDSVHIWVMKEYNVKESWTKQVYVQWPSWLPYRCKYWAFDDESLKDALQSIKHPRFRADSFLKVSSHFRVLAHVGSLLSLKTVAEKERVPTMRFLPGLLVEED